MFTGIVDDVGTIERVGTTGAGRELRVRTRYADLADGESIACNGACLTVRDHGDGWFTVAAVVTTRDRTTIGDWKAGTRINLERALRAGDRLGGHIVQGHVDCVGEVTAVARRDDALLIDVAVPEEIALLMVPHGSVTVDGVSLTVNALLGSEGFQLSIIEYTERQTTVGALRAGSRVHVEADVIAKHVQRLVAAQRAALT
ncbi:MAG: riboflavin synthase [Gemmatimonadaceae bacterium]|nr:riboflavin synthase [Gemmatimonadaceae bacterium]